MGLHQPEELHSKRKLFPIERTVLTGRTRGSKGSTVKEVNAQEDSKLILIFAFLQCVCRKGRFLQSAQVNQDLVKMYMSTFPLCSDFGKGSNLG